MVKHGYSGLTIQRLAAQLDYTPGALYRYFDSKDAIVVAVQERALIKFGALLRTASSRVRQACDGRGGRVPALAEILALLRCYTGLRRVAEAEFIIHSALLGDPRALIVDDLARPSAQPMLDMVDVVADGIRRGQRAGSLTRGDPRQRAMALLGAVQGILQLEKLERLVPDLLHVPVLAGNISRDLLMGWGARRSQVASANALVDEVFGDAGVAEVALNLAREQTGARRW